MSLRKSEVSGPCRCRIDRNQVFPQTRRRTRTVCVNVSLLHFERYLTSDDFFAAFAVSQQFSVLSQSINALTVYCTTDLRRTITYNVLLLYEAKKSQRDCDLGECLVIAPVTTTNVM